MKPFCLLTVILAGAALVSKQSANAQEISSGPEPKAKRVKRYSKPAPHVYPTMGMIERNDPALDALLAADAQIELLASGFAWSEGPVWVRKGEYLLFSDVPRNVVFKW